MTNIIDKISETESNTSRPEQVPYPFESHPALFVNCTLPADNIQLQARKKPSNESVPLHMHCICHMERLALYICRSRVFAPQTSLFLDITSNCCVGFCPCSSYAQKTNEQRIKGVEMTLRFLPYFYKMFSIFYLYNNQRIKKVF